MRWISKQKPPKKQKPRPGNKRERVIFAFLPHRAEDGNTYWLEKIIAIEIFSYFGPVWIRLRYLPLHNTEIV